jgi:serine/threonine protein kinase HipA of HipAB toxin-antitoxin module
MLPDLPGRAPEDRRRVIIDTLSDGREGEDVCKSMDLSQHTTRRHGLYAEVSLAAEHVTEAM